MADELKKKSLLTAFIILTIYIITGCKGTGSITRLDKDSNNQRKDNRSIICLRIKALDKNTEIEKKPYIILSKLSDENMKALDKNPNSMITAGDYNRVYIKGGWEDLGSVKNFNEYLFIIVKPGNYYFMGTAFTKGNPIGPARKIIKVPANRFIYIGDIKFKIDENSISAFTVEHSNDRLNNALKKFKTKYPKLSKRYRGKVYSSFSLISE